MGSLTHSAVTEALRPSQQGLPSHTDKAVSKQKPTRPAAAMADFVGSGAGTPSGFVGLGAGGAAVSATMVKSIGDVSQEAVSAIAAERVRYRLVDFSSEPIELSRIEVLPETTSANENTQEVSLHVLSPCLGEGTFGSVYRVRPEVTPQSIHIQFRDLVLKWGLLKVSEDQLKREAEIFRRVNGGPVRLSFKPLSIDSTGQPSPHTWYYLLMPHLPGKILHEWLYDRSVSAEKKIKIADAAFKALAQLHELGIYHGDLSSSNVLVHEKPDGEFNVFFIDFGFAWLEGESATTFARASRYWHPDRRTNRKDLPSKAYYDVYSLVHILARIWPFLKPYHNPVASSSISEVRAAIAARQAMRALPPAERRLAKQKLTLAEQMIFGADGDSLSEELRPNNFEGHEALLNWLREKNPGAFNSLSLELVGSIHLNWIRQSYHAALKQHCLSEEVVVVNGSSHPRRIIAASCANSAELRDNEAMQFPPRFLSASDEVMTQVLKEVRVEVFVTTISSQADRLLLRVILINGGKDKLDNNLALITDEKLQVIAGNIQPGDADMLWQALQPTTLQGRMIIANAMKQYAEMPVCSVEYFAEHTGFAGESYDQDWWTGFSEGCTALAAHHYKGVIRCARKDILAISPTNQYRALAYHYNLTDSKLISMKLVDWCQLAHQSCFSLILAKAFKGYMGARGQFVSLHYRSYVFSKAEAHNLKSFCQVIARCTKGLSSLHKDSFATFVLEASKQAPWMEEFVKPLFAGSDELARCYKDRLYLPKEDGVERSKGFLFFKKPESRKYRDKVLAAVKEVARSSAAEVFTPAA